MKNPEAPHKEDLVEKEALPSFQQDLESGLYIIATPIGNLGDITLRALDTLKQLDLLLAEDTRHTRHFLDRYGISVPCESYNDFNKEKKTPGFVEQLNTGKKLGLVCDAGTPGVADPAFYLVREAKREGIPVVSVPGACAFITGLVGSGLPTDHFLFANFPPKKSAQRLRQLELYRDLYGEGSKAKWPPTIGFYVGTQQVVKFLGEIGQVFGPEWRVVLARELTKRFEEFLDDSIQNHLLYYKERKPKGEYVLFFHPQKKGDL